MEIERGLSVSSGQSTMANGPKHPDFYPKCITEVPSLEDETKAGKPRGFPCRR
jgi:hypothetical protein